MGSSASFISLADPFRKALGSLKLRLAMTGALLIAVSVGATTFFVLHRLEQRSERAALDSELSDAQRLGNVLSSRLVSLQVSLRSAASRLPADGLGDPASFVRYLDEHAVLRSLFDSISVLSADGHVLAISDDHGTRLSKVSLADRAYFRRTVEDKRPIVSEPVISRLSGEPFIILTMPHLNDKGVMGTMFVGGLRLSSRGLMSDLTRPGSAEFDPVTTIITDSTGKIISHPDKQWLMRDALTEPRIAGAVERWIEQGRPIEPQGQSARIGDYVVATAGVPDADWVIYRTSLAEVVLGGPTEGKKQALWIGAVVALVGGALLLLATFVLLRPLHLLEQRALRLLDDDLAIDEGWPRVGGEIGALSAVFQHVMRLRKDSARAGEELFAKMTAVLDNAPVGIVFTRLSRFELVSVEFSRLLGYEIDQLVGQPTRMICTSDVEYTAWGSRIAAAFDAGLAFDEELELARADGSRLWVRRQGAPVRAGDISAGTIWIFTDATTTREQRELLSWTASHDPLTGLVNRRAFESKLTEVLRDRRRESSCALFIDLDRFKAVNDTAGHAAGDEMLKRVGALLISQVRDNDIVARLGGDEFAILLLGCAPDAAKRIANQICLRVHAFGIPWNGLTLQVGASIGLVEIDESFKDGAAVMAAADSACYEAKHAGRNAVRTYAGGRLRVIEGGVMSCD